MCSDTVVVIVTDATFKVEDCDVSFSRREKKDLTGPPDLLPAEDVGDGFDGRAEPE